MARKKKTDETVVNEFADLSPEEIEKQKRLYEASYEMYEKSKIDTEKRRKEAKDKFGNRMYSDESLKDTLKLMETMQEDIKSKYIKLGGKVEDLYKPNKSTKKIGIDRSKLEEVMRKRMEEELDGVDLETTENNSKNETSKVKTVKTDSDIISLVDKDVKIETDNKLTPTKKTKKTEKKETVKNEAPDEDVQSIGSINMDVKYAVGNNIKYDVIPIPSKGQCYASKISKIPVAYLTAYDENMIISPNLYEDGTFLDHMLKNKIMTSKINPDELLPCDRNAILLWLRASGYGPEYPISVKDDKTNEEFETICDLTKINYKPFKLVGDENGYFDFTMPSSGDRIKFKFLTYGDYKKLEEMSIDEDKSLRKEKILDVTSKLLHYLEIDTEASTSEKKSLKASLDTLRKYAETLNIDEAVYFNRLATNRLLLSIMAVNDVTDRDYISEYITYLNVKDSSALRSYIDENEPNLDLNISVEKPESLGGGSMELFLTLDQYMFLNVNR